MNCSGYFKVALLICFCLSSLMAEGKSKRISLRKAIASKLVKIKATSNGGIGQKSITLELTGNAGDSLLVSIEPALMFRPDDTTRQPLVLQGDEVLALNGGETKRITLDAYCGNSGASCPRPGGNYTLIKQLDTVLVNILRYAKASDIPLELRQCVVWTFTNDHSLNSVYSPYTPKTSENFIKYIAEKRKMKVPPFFMTYGIDSSGNGPTVRPGSERVYVNMNWDVTQGYRNVYVSVYRTDGTVYKRPENDIVSDKNGSAMVVQFSTKRDPAGRYRIRLHDDANNTIQEKTIELGASPERY